MVQTWYSTAATLGSETLCIVVPLRLGIFCTAWITFTTCLLQLFDHSITGWFQNISRSFIGGYGHTTELLANVVSAFGLLFSLAGVSGTWHQRGHLIWLFGMWQMARIAVWGYIYVADLLELYYCELWVNDVHRAASGGKWNQRMYQISLEGECSNTRLRFAVLAMGSIVLTMYLAYCTFKLQGRCDQLPKHLLRINKEPPPSAYYAVSTGERRQRPIEVDGGMIEKPEIEPLRPKDEPVTSRLEQVYGAPQAGP